MSLLIASSLEMSAKFLRGEFESSLNIKSPTQKNLHNIPNEILGQITSYLSKQDVVGLSIGNRDFKVLTTASVESNNFNRIYHMSHILAKSSKIPQLELEEFYNKLKESAKPAASLLEIEQHYTNSLVKLLTLTRKYMTPQYFREQRELFNAKSPDCVIDFASVSSDCVFDFDLLENHQADSLWEIQKIIRKYGMRYFSLAEQFFYKMSNEEFKALDEEDFEFIIECLLRDNQLTKAVNFSHALIRKHLIPNEIRRPYWHPLYMAIVIFYLVEKNDLSGAVTAFKTIAREFRQISMDYLSLFIILALQENNNRVISDIFDFLNLANLDPQSNDALIIKNELKQVVIDTLDPSIGIAKTLKLIDAIPQKEIQALIVETVVQLILNNNVYKRNLTEKEIERIQNSLKKQANSIMKDRENDSHSRLKNDNFVKRISQNNYLTRLAKINLKKNEKIKNRQQMTKLRQRQLRNNSYTKLLYRFLVDLFSRRVFD